MHQERGVGSEGERVSNATFLSFPDDGTANEYCSQAMLRSFLHLLTSGFSSHAMKMFTFLIQPGLLLFMPLPFTLGECFSCRDTHIW